MSKSPNVFGPPMWRRIHSTARAAIIPSKKADFPRFLRDTINSIPCPNCHKHAKQYVSEHPLDSYMNMVDEKGNEIGLFKYTWEFHNAVNVRLRKAFMSWENALRLYPLPVGKPIVTPSAVVINKYPPVRPVPSISPAPPSRMIGNLSNIVQSRNQSSPISPRHATASGDPVRSNVVSSPILLRSPSGRIVGNIPGLTKRQS